MLLGLSSLENMSGSLAQKSFFRRKSLYPGNGHELTPETSTILGDVENGITAEHNPSALKKSEDPPKKLQDGSHLLEYHKPFFDLGFFLLIVPFRLVRVKKMRRYVYAVRSYRIQKILCGLVQLLIAYEYLSSIRMVSWNDIDGTAISYLNVATIFASSMYAFIFIYVFWVHAGLFKKMFEILQDLHFAKCSRRFCRYKIRIISVGFCSFATMVALTDPIIHDGLFTRETISDFLSHSACRARSFYMFQNCSHGHTIPTAAALLENNYTFLENVVTAIHLFIMLPNLVMVHTVDVFVVLTAVCMWHALTYFIAYSKQESVSAEDALVEYEDLKELVKSMNAAVGILTFSAIAISLPFYASWGAIVFNQSDESVDWLYMAHITAYFIHSFTILHFGADFNFKIGEFYSRLTVKEVCERVSVNRLTSVVMDMYSNQISMRACGFFVLTYRFFGTILSLIVTYSIIIIQFQFSRRKLQSVNCTFVEIRDGDESFLYHHNLSMTDY